MRHPLIRLILSNSVNDCKMLTFSLSTICQLTHDLIDNHKTGHQNYKIYCCSFYCTINYNNGTRFVALLANQILELLNTFIPSSFSLHLSEQVLRFIRIEILITTLRHPGCFTFPRAPAPRMFLTVKIVITFWISRWWTNRTSDMHNFLFDFGYHPFTATEDFFLSFWTAICILYLELFGERGNSRNWFLGNRVIQSSGIRGNDIRRNDIRGKLHNRNTHIIQKYVDLASFLQNYLILYILIVQKRLRYLIWDKLGMAV